MVQESIAAYRQLASRPVSRQQVRQYAETVMQFAADESGQLSTRSANVLNAIRRRYEQLAVNGQVVDLLTANWEGAGVGQELNGGGTWWHAYNSLTEYLTHERGRTAESRQESLLFGTSARLNERALSLALELAT